MWCSATANPRVPGSWIGRERYALCSARRDLTDGAAAAANCDATTPTDPAPVPSVLPTTSSWRITAGRSAASSASRDASLAVAEAAAAATVMVGWTIVDVSAAVTSLRPAQPSPAPATSTPTLTPTSAASSAGRSGTYICIMLSTRSAIALTRSGYRKHISMTRGFSAVHSSQWQWRLRRFCSSTTSASAMAVPNMPGPPCSRD
jgi:hypothetical protein